MRYPLLLGAAVLIIAGLALAVWYLYERSNHYYALFHAIRLDPLGVDAFPAADALPDDALHVVFFGDSRAAAWPAPALDGVAFTNRGIGAQTSTQVAGRYPHHITPLLPDVLVVQVGINDLTAVSLFPNDADAIISRVQANIDAIVTQARADGVTLVLTTVFPVGEYPLLRRPFWSDAIMDGLHTVNAHIRALAAPDVIVLDTYALLAGADGFIQPQYAADELHLSPAGYALLNPALAETLAGLR